MALANFFGKNALAAHQILNGVTPATFEEVLGEHVVGIFFDDASAASEEGRTTLTLAVNLAARLYPRIALQSLDAPRGPGRRLVAELEGVARSINPEIDVLSDARASTVAVVVGNTPLHGARETVYVGSDGWTVFLSPERPRGCGGTRNPFGAAAAACLGLANVFRAVFRQYLTGAEPDGELTLSLYDYELHASPAEAPELGQVTVDLGETVLAGVGAIGMAAVGVLARVSGLRGTLHLVDPEVIGLSNLQRYLLAAQAHADRGIFKVVRAAEVLETAQRDRGESGLRVVPHANRWGQFLQARDDWSIPRVLTAFDTKADRVAAQAALPQRLINAWTQLGDLGVSRHLAFGVAPCLACLYRMKPGGKSEAEMVGDAMGFPGAPEFIRQWLHSNAPIPAPFVQEVAGRRGVTSPEAVTELLGFAGRSLREFYNEAFCGGVILRLGGTAGADEVRMEAPMAFQSVLAGVMLAAELVLDAVPRREARAPRPVRTAIDLLRPVPLYLNLPASRRTDGLCLCNDADYLAAYARKYAPTLSA